ncbi:MAG: glycosyltransferase family 4 protein [Actinomycetota bacterium]|jgi:glycosyltransferase involved in cell wall biosynthesis|nr:glycosyltransferase family 4 protein [Actinomycetota bacterium]
MRIAIAGQLSLRQLADLLDEPAAVPAGLGGTPPLPEVRALIARGHDVSLVTLDPDLASEIILRGNRLTVHVGPFRQRHAARDGFKMERQFVAKALLGSRPDVVHAHWTYEFALAALATGLPTVVTAHDAPLVASLRYNLPTKSVGPLLAQLPTAAHWSVRAATAALVAHKAKHLIAVSPYVERHFRHALRYRGEITVVPNMMSPPSRRPVSPIRRPPHDGTSYLTILSSWSALKNGAAAIEAFGQVRAELPKASLRMIGHGFGPGGPAERWAAEHGLTDRVTFVGPLPHDRVLDALAAADILVHPALEESAPMVIAEAQLAGVAVIGGSHSGGVPWILDYDRAGRLVDVRRPSSLAAAMRELALDSTTRSRLARTGTDLARHRHDPERLITSIEALLDAAAHDRRAKTDRIG